MSIRIGQVMILSISTTDMSPSPISRSCQPLERPDGTFSRQAFETTDTDMKPSHPAYWGRISRSWSVYQDILWTARRYPLKRSGLKCVITDLIAGGRAAEMVSSRSNLSLLRDRNISTMCCTYIGSSLYAIPIHHVRMAGRIHNMFCLKVSSAVYSIEITICHNTP